jgi:hypothetical protein
VVFSVDRISHRKIMGKDFTGQVIFDKKKMKVLGDCEAMSGRLSVDAEVDLNHETKLTASLISEGVDINECFLQCEDFGQEFISYKNLDGDLNSYSVVEAHWDDEGKFIRNKLNLISDIRINNGQLRDFELLYQLSDYIKEKDLQHVKFTHLRNWLEIREGTVFLPVMFVQSNALNLHIDGKHDFEQNSLYHVKLNAPQVLWSKIKKHDNSLEPLRARKDGFFNVYYQLKGDSHKFEIASDKKAVKRSFQQSEGHKSDLMQRLFERFKRKDLLEDPEEWYSDIPEYANEMDGEEEYLEGF